MLLVQESPSLSRDGLEPWQLVWQWGLAPCFSVATLDLLAEALRRDCDSLIQSGTVLGAVTPAPGSHYCRLIPEHMPVRCACLVGYAGWKSCGLIDVGQVRTYFSLTLNQADRNLNRCGLPYRCGSFVDWYDRCERTEMRRRMGAEIGLSLLARARVR